MTKILITGGTGLIGSALLPLFGAEDEVHILARAADASANPGGNVHVHEVDLGKRFDRSVLPAQIDSVIYLAQSNDFRDFPEKALDIFEVNVASLIRTLDYARGAGARNFVYASSGGVYGSGSDLFTEDAPIAATGLLGFYLSTKLCGEILAENYAPYMSVVVLRLFFAYGRGQRRTMLVPRLVDHVRAGTPVVLRGAEGLHINPIHATDAAAACQASLALSGLYKINVAGPQVLSLRALCELIGQKIGREPVFEIQQGGVDANYIADIGTMSALLGAPHRRIADHIEELL